MVSDYPRIPSNAKSTLQCAVVPALRCVSLSGRGDGHDCFVKRSDKLYQIVGSVYSPGV